MLYCTTTSRLRWLVPRARVSWPWRQDGVP